ncbi:MAG: DnaD domain protein [Kurthia sp.]|nr:DnaD domain protein [Candidatus Kurthia equi]
MQLYNELQPVDRFTIHIPFPLSSYERKLITLLYQPLIGPEPISLYFLLWAEGEGDEGHDFAHYHLMNGLDMSISSIFNARIALEAIGLLRTYKKQEEHLRYFAYDVMPPLEAKRFFEDPLLSMFLFSKIGESAYRNLLRRFSPKNLIKDGMVEVSRQFTDVYQPIQQHMPENKMEAVSVEKPTEIPFFYREFDFPLLMSGLSESLIPHRLITAEIKETISKIAFMYGLSALEMKNVLIIAIGDSDELTQSAIKKAASEYYKLTISKSPPAITKMLPPEQAHEQAQEWNSKQDELIEYFEQTSPVEVLTAINDGKQPFQKDIELFESLVMIYEISIPVVNVLIHYVSMTSPGRINKNYVDAIASEWRQKGIKTAAQAMNVAREFMDKKNPTVKKHPVQNMHEEYILLKMAANHFYQFDLGKEAKVQIDDLENKFTALMKKAEPLALLQMLADGQEPFSNDLKTVTQFASMYDMERAMLNTLIHYAYFASEGNLNIPFLEAIAGGWRKQSIQTVDAAIVYGQSYRKSRTQKYSRTDYKKETKKELPAWINSSEKPKNMQSLEELERQYKKAKND